MTSMSSVADVKTKALAEQIFSASGTDLSMYLLAHLSGTGTEIVSATVNPLDYTDAGTFSRDYLSVELMSKFPYWDLGIDRAGVALEKFRSAEVQCSAANRRLIDLGANSLITVSTERIMLMARRKIQELLGPYSLLETLGNCRFGPGATTSKSRRFRDVYYKIGDPSPDCSFTLLPVLYYLRHHFPRWEMEPRVVAGSKVVTVPKSAKTDRTICVEPDLNVLVQLGIGRSLRSRLRRVGLLFPDSQEHNARAAAEGSVTGRLATVDLSSASDTISKELVRSLLPSDWLQALEQARTPVAILDGRSIPLEKFSAMGNGYTFELETLIFWSICSSIVAQNRDWDPRVLVYGDDIIIDVRAVGLLSQVFEEVGFTMNPKKTFFTGKFRESCGKHYFNGADVSPFYVRDRLDSPARWCWAANTIRRYSRMHWGLDSRWKPAYDYAVSNVPNDFRCKIPDGYGDGGLIVDFDEATPPRLRHGLEGFSFRNFVPVADLRRPSHIHLVMKHLYQMERTTEDSNAALPRETSKQRFQVGTARQWPSYGPWL